MTKLELTWIGKENRPRWEPWILLEDSDQSYHAQSESRNGMLIGAESPGQLGGILRAFQISNNLLEKVLGS